MIQRIQSFFLFDVVVLAILVLLVFPVLHAGPDIPASGGFLTIQHMDLKGKDIPQLMIITILIAAIAATAIFMFKNRKRQMRVCLTGGIISLLFAVQVVVFPQYYFKMQVTSPVAVKYTAEIGAYLLFAMPVLFFLAYRFVKKDEELVRSADRLR